MPKALPNEPAATAGKANRMLDRLKSHYALGGKLQSRSDKLSTERFAEQKKINYRTMRNFRAFAEHYTPEEFDELCELSRPDGLPIHWGYIPHLLAVEKKGGKVARKRFQKLAATNGWTVPELQLAIQQEYPRKPGHGRSMKKPSSPSVALDQLSIDAERFVKRCRHILDYLEGVPRARRRKAIQMRAKQVAGALGKLAAAATSSTKTLRRW